MDPEQTAPPRQPNTPRNLLRILWGWATTAYGWLLANPKVGLPVALAAGVLIGLAV